MITVEASGLLRFVTPDGVVHRDLADDQVVRLAAKWAKVTTARRTAEHIAALRAAQSPAECSWKCGSCGSTSSQSRRPRMGRSDVCQDPFHMAPAESANDRACCDPSRPAAGQRG